MCDGDLLLLYMTIKHLCTEQTVAHFVWTALWDFTGQWQLMYKPPRDLFKSVKCSEFNKTAPLGCLQIKRQEAEMDYWTRNENTRYHYTHCSTLYSNWACNEL